MVLDGAQIVTIVLAVLCLIWWTVAWYRCGAIARAQSTAAALWALHVIAFSVAALFRWPNVRWLNVWSSALHIHGLIAWIVLAADHLIAECKSA